MFKYEEIENFYESNKNNNKFSQNGEEIILEFLVEKLCPPPFCVEFGASDGKTYSNTKKLVDSGWGFLLMDGNPKANHIKKEWITGENIPEILEKHEVPKKLGVLSVDVDGNDLYILESILRSWYEPQIIVAEFNRAFLPDEAKTIKYDPNHEFKYDVYYGASFGAFKEMLSKYGYDIIYVRMYNLFAVKKELLGDESFSPVYETSFDFPDTHGTYKNFVKYEEYKMPEIEVERYKKDPSSIYGEWFFEEHNRVYRNWSVAIAKDFVERNKIYSMVDLGCGIGSYIEGAMLGGAKVVKGYELCLENAIKYIPESVKPFVECRDVTLALDKSIQYDCAISIEVAEHIAPESSDDFVCNMFDLSKNLIVLTAAPPGQGGTGHINCQTKEFWLRKFLDKGCVYDGTLVSETCKIWIKLGAHYYIMDNLMIFRKGNS